MSKKCEFTGVASQFGHKVSHSNRKTNKCFLPNLRVVRYKSLLTGQTYKFTIAAKAIRTVDKLGGFDSFMKSFSCSGMSSWAKNVRRLILGKVELGNNTQAGVL